ncbi:MAG: UbiA family prenyltransferase, partial [Thaumarchaeota archaeon]|nr:UbiA family prenyltransferase [Candidatus Calditenuaceae archaeon]MDW8186527.1 UbiA family prenyltransferase [Nitrososphaerota archaeon]
MITAATLQEYEQVSVSYVDEEGYPVTLPAKVKLEDGKVLIELPEGYRTISLSGRRVNVILNHITPIPGGGYTDRRYFVIRGVARMSPEGVELDVERTYRWNEKEVPFPEYVEVSTPRAKGYLERLGLKLGVNFKPRIGAFWTFFRVVRFPFLSATAVPVATGAAVALYRGAFDPLLLLLTFLGLAFIHMALNVANDYFDTKLGADPANRRPTPFSGGSRS